MHRLQFTGLSNHNCPRSSQLSTSLGYPDSPKCTHPGEELSRPDTWRPSLLCLAPCTDPSSPLPAWCLRSGSVLGRSTLENLRCQLSCERSGAVCGGSFLCAFRSMERAGEAWGGKAAVSKLCQRVGARAWRPLKQCPGAGVHMGSVRPVMQPCIALAGKHCRAHAFPSLRCHESEQALVHLHASARSNS